MKITSITLYKVAIPMITSFATSFGKIIERPTVLVKAETDEGLVGWGESAALPYPIYKLETTDTCVLVLRDYIAPLVLNKQFTTIEEFAEFLVPIKQHYIAKTGLETAIWSILSEKSGISLSELIGGTQSKVAIGESIGVKDSLEETLEEIALRLDQGFRRIKIKIKPGWDLKVVESVRNKFGNISLMVDANSAYTLADVDALKSLDNYDLIMIEQPLAEDDIVDHSILQKQLKTAICLDESILNAEDARRAITLGSCKIINIKPGRVGGLLESKKIHDYCGRHNVGVWCGGMLEFGIGRAYNLAVASLPNCIFPADMSPVNFYFIDDVVTSSFVVDKEGYVSISSQPGLGYQVDKKKINKYTVDKIVLK